VERLSTGGPVLGVFADASYDQRQISIARGDRSILFTDGITEVRPAGIDPQDPRHVEFGEDALIALANDHRSCSAPALQARLTAAVSAFAGGTFQDDATLIVLAMEQSRENAGAGGPGADY